MSKTKIMLVVFGLSIVVSFIALAISSVISENQEDTEDEQIQAPITESEDSVSISTDSPSNTEEDSIVADNPITTNTPPRPKDITIDSEDKFRDGLLDNFKIEDLQTYRQVIDDYFHANGSLPANNAVLNQLIGAETIITPSYDSSNILALTTGQVADGLVYYSPQDIDFTVNVPAETILIIGQAKCNMSNATIGIAVNKDVITIIDTVNQWGQPINLLDSNTTIEGASSSVAIIFSLKLEGVNYTYCHHDYAHNYDFEI